MSNGADTFGKARTLTNTFDKSKIDSDLFTNTVSWYGFNIDNGDATMDLGTNSNDGDLGDGAAAPTVIDESLTNKYVDFDGGDEIDMGDLANFDFAPNDPFSITVWINTDQTNTGQGIVTRFEDGTGDGIVYVLGQSEGTAAGGLDFGIFDDSEGAGVRIITAPFILTIGQWHHLAATSAGLTTTNGLALYLDGLLQTPIDSSSGSYTAMENLATPLRVGTRYRNGAQDRQWQGGIDVFRLYNRALTSNEVFTASQTKRH